MPASTTKKGKTMKNLDLKQFSQEPDIREGYDRIPFTYQYPENDFGIEVEIDSLVQEFVRTVEIFSDHCQFIPQNFLDIEGIKVFPDMLKKVIVDQERVINLQSAAGTFILRLSRLKENVPADAIGLFDDIIEIAQEIFRLLDIISPSYFIDQEPLGYEKSVLANGSKVKNSAVGIGQSWLYRNPYDAIKQPVKLNAQIILFAHYSQARCIYIKNVFWIDVKASIEANGGGFYEKIASEKSFWLHKQHEILALKIEGR